MHTRVHANAKQVISHKGVRMAEVSKALSDPAAPRQVDLNMSDEMLLFGRASWSSNFHILLSSHFQWNCGATHCCWKSPDKVTVSDQSIR